VAYRLTSDPETISPALAGREVFTIIWTTTPWTLPASLAVAFHPDFDYVALENTDGKVYIVAEALAAAVKAACKLDDAQEIARFKGAVLERKTFQHPFLDRSILGVLATYVTADTGTGAVHTAPSHGADDFYTGQKYGLDPTCRVDAAGHIHVDPDAWPLAVPPPFEGKKVWAANPVIVAMLEESGALLAVADLHHSYPHCWRCHKPVIFRATEQWFINMETEVERQDGTETTYRQLTIEEIDKVIWDPGWGKERITNMIATRPDWCISRQRIWGVPIAVFLCDECNQPILDTALNRAIVELFDREGAEAWHTAAGDAMLPKNATCANCGGKKFRKETDILDVWFDSGVSWFAVCETDPDLKDIYSEFQNGNGTKVFYIEGGDQHRGWFHSSLLTSVALRGRAPYSHVATVGWTLDEQGRAMSKSLGNGVDPVDIANRLGGEIVRLWVASIDFREDMAASENLMQRCADLYRKLRNTFRFLLGNLSSSVPLLGNVAAFDPVRDRVAESDLLPLDRYMLARTRELTEKIRGWYETFEFHRVYHAVNEFAIVDLSSFYLDVLKDRMYTFAPTSRERRSAQTVLWQITEALTRLVAPILTFTADEVWEYLPEVEGREASVHLAQFPKPEEIFSEDPAALLDEWKQLFAVRDVALVVLEEARQAKTIGKGLEAELEIVAAGHELALLERHAEGLKEILNVSGVKVNSGPALTVMVLPATGSKCARCWNFMPHVSNYGIWENVCDRCQSALSEMNIPPPQPEAAA
jgi:isoleucyl-tRNA synthetase